MRCATVLILLLSLSGGDSHLDDDLRALQEAVEAIEPGAGFRFELFPVAALMRPAPDFVAPRLDDSGSGPLFPGHQRPGQNTFWNTHDLADLIVGAVEPRSWIGAGAIEPAGRHLVVYQSDEVLAKVHAFLDGLRARLHRSVCVEVRVGAEFEGRILGLSGQRVSLAHGAQRAFHGDPEVEVAKDNGQTTDPVIETLQTGGYVTVRATLGDDPGQVRVELEVFHREAPDPLRKSETGVNGELELPDVVRRDCRTDLIVDAGVWVRVSDAIELRATPSP